MSRSATIPTSLPMSLSPSHLGLSRVHPLLWNSVHCWFWAIRVQKSGYSAVHISHETLSVSPAFAEPSNDTDSEQPADTEPVGVSREFLLETPSSMCVRGIKLMKHARPIEFTQRAGRNSHMLLKTSTASAVASLRTSRRQVASFLCQLKRFGGRGWHAC